jgi:two-component system response regulator AtoC
MGSRKTLRTPDFLTVWLRVRGEDLLPLCEHFISEYARIFARPKPKLNREMVAFFHSYRWPGNIAELATAIKSLVVLGDDQVVLAALRASSWSHPRNGNLPPASLKEASRAASLEAERELIADVLTATGWNRKKTAVQLQISYKALLYKLKDVGLDSVIHRRSPESKDL